MKEGDTFGTSDSKSIHRFSCHFTSDDFSDESLLICWWSDRVYRETVIRSKYVILLKYTNYHSFGLSFFPSFMFLFSACHNHFSQIFSSPEPKSHKVSL